MVTNLEFFGVFSVLFFHPNSHIARYAPLSDERKSLGNTSKQLPSYFLIVAKNQSGMPTVFDLFGIRAFIIPGDHEPIHVHIEAEGGFAKIEVYPEVKIIKQDR